MLNFQNGCLRLKKEKKGGGIESKFSMTKIGRFRGGCKRLHSRRTELKKKISVINASVLYLLAKNINLKTHLKGQDSKVGKRVVLGLLVRRKEINK